MMQQGWISSNELRAALQAQRRARTGRIGHWLVRQNAASEELVTKALGLQWSCPVLNFDVQSGAMLPNALPRLFIDAFGCIPLRAPGSNAVYLGFESRLDPVLALAFEKMIGLQVDCGIVPESLFRVAQARVLAAAFPYGELVEASCPEAAALAFAKCLERTRSIASRLVRVHDCLWMRIWSSPQHGAVPEPNIVRDVICLIGPIR